MSIHNARLILKTYRETFRSWLVGRMVQPLANEVQFPTWIVVLFLLIQVVLTALVAAWFA